MADDLDVVARARAALDGVTEGPWRWEFTLPRTFDSDQLVGPGWDAVLSAGCRGSLHVDAADAEFIAAARSLVPELIAEVVALRERQVMLRDALDEARRVCQDALP